MSPVFAFRRRVLVAACAAVLFLGCGPRGVKVEGKLLNNGQPYTPPQGGNLTLSFADADGKAYAATVNSDGSFVANGVNGAGLPPGKYKVSMSLAAESTDAASLEKMNKDAAQFAAINGKEFDVTADPPKPITIDIGAGTVAH